MARAEPIADEEGAPPGRRSAKAGARAIMRPGGHSLRQDGAQPHGDSGTAGREEAPRRREERGAKVRAYDPLITKLDGLHVCGSAREALKGADAAIVVTAWPEFAVFDWRALSAIMRRPILIDGRNALRGAAMPETTTCVPIGRHFEPQGVAVAV